MTDTANLEDGFYWVRYDCGTWVVGCIDGGFLSFAQDPKEYDLSYLSENGIDEIDPRPIKREGMERPQ